MNKKHVSLTFEGSVKEWKKNPVFAATLEMAKEKRQMAQLLRETRRHAGLTQKKLSELAGVTQPVIARIETNQSDVLPRLDVYNKIMRAMGYRTVLGVEKLSRRKKSRAVLGRKSGY